MFLCKNTSSHIIRFDGVAVPRNGYYGQTLGGIRFIAVVHGNQIGMKWHNAKSLSFWYNDYKQEVVDAIRDGFLQPNPERVRIDWNDKKAVKQYKREQSKYAGAFSSDAVRRHHVNVSRRPDPRCFSGDYLDTVRKQYGQEVHRKQVNYLDGYR